METNPATEELIAFFKALADANRLKIIGLLRVMFDPRTTLQQQVSEQLKDHFGNKVFDTVIPRNVRLAEAPSYGVPGVVFDPAAKGSKAFVEFAKEMVVRVGGTVPKAKASKKTAAKATPKAAAKNAVATADE